MQIVAKYPVKFCVGAHKKHILDAFENDEFGGVECGGSNEERMIARSDVVIQI